MKLNMTEMKTAGIQSIEFLVQGLVFDLSDKGAIFEIQEVGSNYGFTNWNATVTNVNSLAYLNTKFGPGAQIKAEVNTGENGYSYMKITGVKDAHTAAQLESRKEGNKQVVTALGWPDADEPSIPAVSNTTAQTLPDQSRQVVASPQAIISNKYDLEGVIVERSYNLMKAFRTDPRGVEIAEWLGEDLFKKEFCTTMRSLMIAVFDKERQYNPTEMAEPSDDELDAAINELNAMSNN